MITVRCVRRLLSASSLRFTSQLSHVDEALTPPTDNTTTSKVLPVPKLEQIENKGEHYQKSYRQFTSWLNSGGHAEAYEGCLVIGKVAKVFKGEKEATTLAVDWGHKHLGYTRLQPDQASPEESSHVICRLKAFENVALIMGHDQYERHNQAVLEYIETVPSESVTYSIAEQPVLPESSPQSTELHPVDANESLMGSEAEVNTSEASYSVRRDKPDDKPKFNIRDVRDKEKNAPKFVDLNTYYTDESEKRNEQSQSRSVRDFSEKSNQRNERGNSNNRNNYQRNKSWNAENGYKTNYNQRNREGNAENRKWNSSSNRKFNSNKQNIKDKPRGRGPRDNDR